VQEHGLEYLGTGRIEAEGIFHELDQRWQQPRLNHKALFDSRRCCAANDERARTY
jgi:hypothetical protein